MNIDKLIAVAASIAFLPVLASAAVVSVVDGTSTLNVGGAAEIIGAPANLLDDNVTNDRMQAFDEIQNHILTDDITVDGGVSILKGTRVDSHMIFLNSSGGTRIEHFNVLWTFSGTILGVMSDRSGQLEAATSGQLGASGSNYTLGVGAAPFNARGLEGNNGCGTSFFDDGYAVVSSNVLCVGMEVTEPGDWIRVVTAATVPIPAGLPLMLTGIAGLGWAARRKRKQG